MNLDFRVLQEEIEPDETEGGQPASSTASREEDPGDNMSDLLNGKKEASFIRNLSKIAFITNGKQWKLKICRVHSVVDSYSNALTTLPTVLPWRRVRHRLLHFIHMTVILFTCSEFYKLVKNM